MMSNAVNDPHMETKRPARQERALILDYGEVLCKPPAAVKIAQMASALGLDRETFQFRYEDERKPYDRGDLNPLDYWSRVAAPLALDEQLLSRMRQWDVELWNDVNQGMIAWLARVRAAGLKTAMLSNMHPDMASYVRRNFDWFQHLDCLILSCEVHLIKPVRAIYERCLEQLGVQPCEALFIDDREVNVRAAADAGLVTLRFTNIESLRSDLEALGFPVLP